MTPAQTLKRAAQLLAEDAQEMKRSHTIDGKWDEARMDTIDREAKAYCDEHTRIAASLIAIAEAF